MKRTAKLPQSNSVVRIPWHRWRQLQSRFVGDWWSNRSARPKTRRALQALAKRISPAALKRVPRKIVVTAPHPCIAGEVSTGYPKNKYRLYLSPQIEVVPQAEVNSIVAHEFAHLVLKDWAPANAESNYGRGGVLLPCESSADKLMESWGFAPMNRARKAPLLTLLGKVRRVHGRAA